jgi:hypothetical protein
LAQPGGDWTADRLAADRNAAAGLPSERRRSQEVLGGAGRRWREQETRFGRRVDPDFAATGGR